MNDDWNARFIAAVAETRHWQQQFFHTRPGAGPGHAG